MTLPPAPCRLLTLYTNGFRPDRHRTPPLQQSVVLSFFGVILGWDLAAALAGAFDAWEPVVESQLDLDLVIEVSAAILASNVLAALLPVRHVSRIDPQEVFKA